MIRFVPWLRCGFSVGLVFPFRLSVGYAAACGLVFPGFGWYVGYAAVWFAVLRSGAAAFRM